MHLWFSDGNFDSTESNADGEDDGLSEATNEPAEDIEMGKLKQSYVLNSAFLTFSLNCATSLNFGGNRCYDNYDHRRHNIHADDISFADSPEN